jgi:glutamate/tyrosine decarboxylase-like PLP-dependent enzyme
MSPTALRPVLPAEGRAEAELNDELGAILAMDADWQGGRIWGYVYPAGEAVDRVAKAAYMRFLVQNGLDPTAFPSVMALENALVAIAAAHLRGPEAVGNFTSGGTESILLAVKAARDAARAEPGRSGRLNIVLPETAHAAFHKAAHYLDLEVRSVAVDPLSFRATAPALAAAMDANTALLVASAPSYAHGVIDDVEGIAALGLAAGVRVHVDGCVGGWLLPFFAELGRPVPAFDFSVPGVTSISLDLHKYALCPKGASLILHKNKALREAQLFSCSGWTGYTIINPTVQSTRSGGPVAAAWATLQTMGRAGYLQVAAELAGATDALIAGLQAIPGLRVLGAPSFTMVAFTAEDPTQLDVFVVADEMGALGWGLQPQLGHKAHPRNLHISVHPGVVGQVEPMLADLRRCVAAAVGRPADPELAALAPMLQALRPEDLSAEAVGHLLSAAGISGAALPAKMAPINGLLDTLAPEVADRLLTGFYSELNIQRAPEGSE